MVLESSQAPGKYWRLLLCPVDSHVWLFVTPWTAAHQASLSFTIWSLLKLMSIELVMPSNHLVLCRPLLLLPLIFPSIRVFSSLSALQNQVAKVLELQLQHLSFQWIFRVDFLLDFPGGSDGRASVYNAGDPGSIPGLERPSGEGNGNPLQYSWFPLGLTNLIYWGLAWSNWDQGVDFIANSQDLFTNRSALPPFLSLPTNIYWALCQRHKPDKGCYIASIICQPILELWINLQKSGCSFLSL